MSLEIPFLNTEAGPQIAADVAAQVRRSIELKLRGEQLRVMYSQLVPRVWGVLILAIPLSCIFLPLVDHVLLGIWFGLVALNTVVRTVIVLAYKRKSPSDVNVPHWERLFVWPQFAAALIWGIGGVLLMPPDMLLYQLVIFFGLISISAAVANLSTVQSTLEKLTLLAYVLPITLHFFWQRELIQVTTALVSCVTVFAIMRSMSVQNSMLQKSFHLSYELQLAKAQAEQLARTDMLTGLNNRRAFTEQAGAVLSHVRRLGTPVAAIMLDIDNFKKINDTYGHPTGDAALQHLARLLKDSLRESDVCGRVGGEEFAILLPGSGINDARGVAEKLRERLAASTVSFNAQSIAMTASLGVSCGSLDMQELLRVADTALYRAKEGGRNKVVCMETALA